MRETIKKLLKAVGLIITAQKICDFPRVYSKRRRNQARYRKREKVMRTYGNLFYLNIGSGLFVRKNWRLLDYSDSHSYHPCFVGDSGQLLDYNIDLTTCKKLPVPDDSVDMLFSSHCFEHIGDKATQNVLNEAYRIMKKGVVFRIILTDADLAYDAYKRNDFEWFVTIKSRRGDESKSIEWYYFRSLSATFMGNRFQIRDDVEKLSKEDFFEKYHYGEMINHWHNVSGRMTWFNFDKIKKMARNAGFIDIRRSSFLQSVSEEMRALEFDTRKGKLKNDTREKISLYVDMVR